MIERESKVTSTLAEGSVILTLSKRERYVSEYDFDCEKDVLL